MDNVREELLQGINYVTLDVLPGQIAVYGESAEPVLTAASTQEVFLAAADVGLGRIVVASHSGFSASFNSNDGPTAQDAPELGNLQENIKKWLSKGAYNHGDPIANASEISDADLGAYKIVFWTVGSAGVSAEKMLEFVKGGGGLFHAVTPWGWLLGNAQKALSDIPYWKVLLAGGLCYTRDYCSEPADPNGYSVEDNEAADAHLRRYIQSVGDDLDKACCSSGMMKLLKKVPDSALADLQPLLEPLWHKCNGAVQESPIASGEPVEGDKARGMLHVWHVCHSMLGVTDVKAAGVQHFPGDLDTAPHPKRVSVEFNSKDTEYFFTGCYALAAQTIKVVTNSGNWRLAAATPDIAWRVMIGCHSDRLTEDTLQRWPNLVAEAKLTDRVVSLSSPFGGGVYFLSPPGQSGKLQATLDNVIESPTFKWTDGDAGKLAWQTSRRAPGLWADISGQYITITVPASSVRDIEDPTAAIAAYDVLISSYHELRGTDVTKARRQWIVTDKQTDAGYMHAGYPVVTHLDVSDPKSEKFLLSVDKLKKSNTDSWGLFHELGHNMQRPEWTFDGTIEVTVNIFTMFATEKFVGEKPWLCEWLAKQIRAAVEYLKHGAAFAEWTQQPGVALVVYAQLARDFGWDAYRKVFRRYEALTVKDKPVTNEDKIDQWYTNFSEVAGFNLTPLAAFWGIPLSKSAVDKLHDQGLPCFLPDDEVTQAVPDRTNEIVEPFPGIARKV